LKKITSLKRPFNFHAAAGRISVRIRKGDILEGQAAPRTLANIFAREQTVNLNTVSKVFELDLGEADGAHIMDDHRLADRIDYDSSDDRIKFLRQRMNNPNARTIPLSELLSLAGSQETALAVSTKETMTALIHAFGACRALLDECGNDNLAVLMEQGEKEAQRIILSSSSPERIETILSLSVSRGIINILSNVEGDRAKNLARMLDQDLLKALFQKVDDAEMSAFIQSLNRFGHGGSKVNELTDALDESMILRVAGNINASEQLFRQVDTDHGINFLRIVAEEKKEYLPALVKNIEIPKIIAIIAALLGEPGLLQQIVAALSDSSLVLVYSDELEFGAGSYKRDMFFEHIRDEDIRRLFVRLAEKEFQRSLLVAIMNKRPALYRELND